MRPNVIVLRDLPFEIDDSELHRLLGYRSGGGPSREEVERSIRDMKELSWGLIAPAGAYAVFPAGDVAGRGPFENAERVGLGLSTIGGALEKKVRELFSANDFLNGLVLDTIGSVAVESVVDRLNGRICSDGEREGLTGDRRSSPGYGSWRLENQELFFELLPHRELGMELTPSYMMIPRKSVSFAVNLRKDGRKAWSSSRCARCGLADCPYRVSDERGEG